jgi:hypothetical protein
MLCSVKTQGHFTFLLYVYVCVGGGVKKTSDCYTVRSARNINKDIHITVMTLRLITCLSCDQKDDDVQTNVLCTLICFMLMLVLMHT